MSQSETKGPHHPDDKFFKAVFKQPEHVLEILEDVTPEALLSALQLSTLRVTDASFVDEQLAEPYTPQGGYILVDLSKMSDERIMRFRSGFLTTALLLMKHRKEQEFLLENLVLIINFVEVEDVEESVRMERLKLTLRYLRSLKSISTKEIKSKIQSLMSANQVWNVLAEERAEGFEEGMEKGMDIGARTIIASLIHHLPEADDETIANLSSQPVELVAQVRAGISSGE